LNARLRNLSKEIHVSPQILLRFYLMEHLLERISMSKYKRHFILKGGMLIASMVGLQTRSTMDIDALMKDVTVSEESVRTIFSEITGMNCEGGIELSVSDIWEIREEAEYTGFRVSINAILGSIRQNFKVDISVGDVVVPGAVKYEYPLMLQDKRIEIFAYSLETVLAEKLETILARGIANTRMRDFYDVFTLWKIFGKKMDTLRLKEALAAVVQNRGSEKIIREYRKVIASIKTSQVMANLWERYVGKNDYAENVLWQDTNAVIETILDGVLADM
jgi:predicted nucleotidyltransferase component of viral defense system